MSSIVATASQSAAAARAHSVVAGVDDDPDDSITAFLAKFQLAALSHSPSNSGRQDSRGQLTAEYLLLSSYDAADQSFELWLQCNTRVLYYRGQMTELHHSNLSQISSDDYKNRVLNAIKVQDDTQQHFDYELRRNDSEDDGGIELLIYETVSTFSDKIAVIPLTSSTDADLNHKQLMFHLALLQLNERLKVKQERLNESKQLLADLLEFAKSLKDDKKTEAEHIETELIKLLLPVINEWKEKIRNVRKLIAQEEAEIEALKPKPVVKHDDSSDSDSDIDNEAKHGDTEAEMINSPSLNGNGESFDIDGNDVSSLSASPPVNDGRAAQSLNPHSVDLSLSIAPDDDATDYHRQLPSLPPLQPSTQSSHSQSLPSRERRRSPHAPIFDADEITSLSSLSQQPKRQPRKRLKLSDVSAAAAPIGFNEPLRLAPSQAASLTNSANAHASNAGAGVSIPTSQPSVGRRGAGIDSASRPSSGARDMFEDMA